MFNETRCPIKCQQLLRELKTTVEGLLVSQVANVWSIYGGLNRLHSSIDKIFKHGCLESGPNSYLNFIQGLEWLQPESAKSYLSVDCEYRPHVPTQLKNNKSSIWLYHSLENHSLSQKLSWLLTDKNHLNSCYQSHAFLRQEKYSEALLTCLRAVERNQPSSLCEIDPCLFLNKMSAREFHKVHRRCSSFPDAHYRSPVKKNFSSFDESDLSKEKKVEFDNRKIFFGKLKPWNSTPNLSSQNLSLKENSKIFSRSRTTPSTPIHSRAFSKATTNIKSSLSSGKKKSYPRRGILKKSPKLKHVLINNVVEYTPPLSSSQESKTEDLGNLSTKSMPDSKSKSPIRKIISLKSESFRESFNPRAGQRDYRRHPKRSFIEDGGMKVQPVATGYFPRPTKGQTLTSFLTSNAFAQTNAELDWENAHFSISEAMIAAVEQMKCKRDLTLADDQVEEESDPEIMALKQRIRLRRKQKLVELQRKMWSAYALTSDGVTDTTTEASVSPYSTSPDSASDSISTEDVDDMEIDNLTNLTDDHGLSVSMASLYSEADIFKKPRSAPDGASDVLSAEGVALSLISRFNEKQLPKASELEWMVSEEEAPQALLPLPKSWPISPDELEEIPPTPLRGTKEWAPPRPQIIFTLHPSPDRKILLEKQNYRCAGCSMKVVPKYSSCFRYCDYLGRYFCTGCHTNQMALIPARVIQKWDFTRYPVSNFSYRLLEQMYQDKLFRIFDLNKNIGKRSKNLINCRKYRTCLCLMKDFIFTCRYAENIQELLSKEFPNISFDPEVYSMDDLVNIRSGEMKSNLKYLVELCFRHTSECKLCMARGFICEICRDDNVIFPWQMKIVKKCSDCKSCFHAKCWKVEEPCLKCTRINKRKKEVQSTSQ